MAALKTGVIQALETEIRKDFKKAYDEGPDHSSRLASVVSSTHKVETYAWMKRIPQAREWFGPRVLQNLDTISTQATNKDFELTVGVDRNDILDDSLGMFSNVVGEMGRQMRYVPTKLIIDLMVNGTTGLGFDGVAQFASTHDLDPLGNQSNLGSTALSAASWEATRATMQQFTGEDGRPLGVNPNLIVIPPQLEGTAKALLTAERNANGATNINNGEAQYLVIPELTDANDWYALDTSKGVMPFLYQNRQSPNFVAKTAVTDDNVFSLRRFVWGSDMRGVALYGPWFLSFKHVVA